MRFRAVEFLHCPEFFLLANKKTREKLWDKSLGPSPREQKLPAPSTYCVPQGEGMPAMY